MGQQETRKKVAIISGSFPPSKGGGVASSHYNLYLMFKKKGFNVKCFSYGEYNLKDLENDDIIRSGTPLKINRLIGFILSSIFFLIDRNKINYQTYDILSSGGGSLCMNWKLKKFNPDFLILPDHDCPGFFINKNKNCMRILISHHNPIRFLNNPLIGNMSKRDVKIALWLESKALKKVDTVICPSEYMKNTFLDTYPFEGNVYCIPNFINTDLIASISPKDVRNEMKIPKDSIVIYIPSAGSVLKGSEFIFEIIRRIHLVNKSVGFFLSGELDNKLQYQLSHAPNINIYAPGHLNYHDNIALIKSCSLCISPTLIESFGMAILEANFCGLPVVTFDTGGNKEIIENGKNGYLVPYLDVESLINYSTKLLDDNFRTNLQSHIEENLSKKFNYKWLFEELLNVLQAEIN